MKFYATAGWIAGLIWLPWTWKFVLIVATIAWAVLGAARNRS